jgi:hypothetical protein
MLFLKFSQHLHLLLILARWLAHLLLPLIIHHLLNHTPRFAVQIAQLAVLGRDFACINLWGGGDDVGPPFHLVDFVEVDVEFLARRRCFERPGGFVDVDGVREGALVVCSVVATRAMWSDGTSMIGIWPLTPAFMLVFVIFTSRSLPFILLGIGEVMSRSPICCTHL